jgi:hypothetical protein
MNCFRFCLSFYPFYYGAVLQDLINNLKVVSNEKLDGIGLGIWRSRVIFILNKLFAIKICVSFLACNSKIIRCLLLH